MKKSNSKHSQLLTETELELMNILWDLEEGTVREVMAKLPAGRELAYTSVSTILRILEKKSVLNNRKQGKNHIYYPLISREMYQERGLDHLISTVFSGAPISLIKTLVSSKHIKSSDLDELKNFISGQPE